MAGTRLSIAMFSLVVSMWPMACAPEAATCAGNPEAETYPTLQVVMRCAFFVVLRIILSCAAL